MNNKKSLIRNLVLLGSILIFVIVMIVSIGDIKAIYETIINVDYRYILVILGLVILYLILWPLSLVVLARKEVKDVSLGDLYLISSSEFFFNGITPFSSGGQPFQAYALRQKSVKLSQSTSILMINFIIYQVVINIFSITAISIYYNTVKESLNNFVWFVIVGFAMNLIVLIILLSLALSKKIANLIRRFFVFVTKFKLLNRLQKYIANFDLYVEEVQMASKMIFKNIKIIILTIVFKIVALAIYYLIPFFGIKALHLEIDYSQIFYVISMTCFAMTMVVFIPTPGASGGAEFAFSLIFSSLALSTNLSLSLMLIWRFFTYYLVMIFGFIMYLIFERRVKKCESVYSQIPTHL